MKRILLLIVCFSVSSYTYSQKDTVQTYMYAEILGFSWLGNKVNVSVDFGQKKSIWKPYDYMTDSNGKLISFNSMIDAMNYMGLDGWEFVQAYVVTTGNQNVYHWLLKKRIDVLSEQQKQEAIQRLQEVPTVLQQQPSHNISRKERRKLKKEAMEESGVRKSKFDI